VQQSSIGTPGWQMPKLQDPVSVQALPSSHGTLFMTSPLFEQQAVTW
jgi:hypothetical protein